MTAVAPQSVVPRPFPPVNLPRGNRFLGYLSTTDPKRLGAMDMVTSVRVLHGRCVGVADAGRAARPGPQSLPGAVRPVVHHAPHDHAAVLRDAGTSTWASTLSTSSTLWG